MTRILKYPIHESRIFTLNVPRGSQALCARDQRGIPQIWFLVSGEQPSESRRFRVYDDGDTIQETKISHIATFATNHVFHLFEVHYEHLHRY